MAADSGAEAGIRPEARGFRLARILSLCALYLIALLFSRYAASKVEVGALFDAHLGVVVGAFLALPRRNWLAMFVVFALGAAVASLALNLGLNISFAAVIIEIGAGLLAAILLRRPRSGHNPLADLGSFWRFILVATIAALIAGTADAASNSLQSSVLVTSQVWVEHCGAALIGILLCAVPTFQISTADRSVLDWRPSLAFFAAACPALLGAASVYLNWQAGILVPVFLPAPFLVWMAIRRPVPETSWILLAVALIDTLGMASGHGFAQAISASAGQRAAWLHVFLAIRAGTILMLATITTVRNQTDKVAEEHAARLISMVDAVPDAIITIDEHGSITFFSTAAERMFQYDSQEVIGKNVKMLMPSPYHSEHDAYLARYLKTGKKRIIGIGRVVVARRKDGSTFPIELAVGEALLHGQHVFTGLIRDISEKQQIERRLHEVQSDLLHVSRLSAMGELAAALAHELNQPLTAINNYMLAARQLMMRSAVDPGQISEIIAKSAAQAVRAGQIIRQLRQFVERREVEWEPVDINRILDEASALAFVGLKERGVHVRIDRLENPPPVSMDKIQIQQVLINLIRNAVDAMMESPRRELTISVSASAEEIDIAIADTGSGISPEIADKLFQPFTSTKASGMGVGLSISRTIVEAHGGQLWFEAKPTGGTIFHMILSLQPDQRTKV